MAKFCGKCGAKLDEATGLCPNCDAEKIKESTVQEEKIEVQKQKRETVRAFNEKNAKEKRKAEKKKKWAKLTTGQKIRKFFLKLALWLILLFVIAGGIIGGLSYMEMLDIPLLSNFNKDTILETLNERAVVVEKTDIVMVTGNEGTAKIVVQLPDYELLFKGAYASDNPDQYLVGSLALGKYGTKEYERVATVTVEGEEATIHSDEVVHQLLEEALINAINTLSEVE